MPNPNPTLRPESYSISYRPDDDPNRRHFSVDVWRVGNGDSWVVGQKSSPAMMYRVDGTEVYTSNTAEFALPLQVAEDLARAAALAIAQPDFTEWTEAQAASVVRSNFKVFQAQRAA